MSNELEQPGFMWGAVECQGAVTLVIYKPFLSRHFTLFRWKTLPKK